jgi:parallel beta-helix repeat protein
MTPSWIRSLFNGARVKPITNRKLAIDHLETRDVPATYTVTSLANSGTGSLREAVGLANSNLGLDTINFAGGGIGTITLTSQINITDDLDILGPNQGINPNTTARNPETTISGAVGSKLFVFNALNVDLKIDGLRFTNGSPIHHDWATNGPTNSTLYFQNNLIENADHVRLGGGSILNEAYILNNRFLNINAVPSLPSNGSSAIFIRNPLKVDIKGNYIDGANYTGIHVENYFTTGPEYNNFDFKTLNGNVTIEDNTIKNVYRQGIYLTGANNNVTIKNNILDNASTYADPERGAITFRAAKEIRGTIIIDDNTITNSRNGIAIRNGTGNDITGKDIQIKNNDINGNATAAIYHGGRGELNISPYLNTIDGVAFGTGATPTQSQLFALEDKLLYGIDISAATTSLIRVNAGEIYVTPNTLGIQRAIDLASNGDTINIQSGIYLPTTDSADAVTGGKNLAFEIGAPTGQVTLNGNLQLNTGDTFIFDVNGGAPLTGYDQWVVNGNVNVSNATLQINFSNSFFPLPGESFTLIANNGSNPIVGTFNGLPDGHIFTFNSMLFQLNYNVGSGNNDLVLTRLNATEVYVDDAWIGFGYGTAIPDGSELLAGNQTAFFGVNAFATLNDAFAAVAAGGTIYVNTAILSESLYIDKAVTILGRNAFVPATGSRFGESVVRAPSNDPILSDIFTIDSDNVTISGLTIDGYNPDILSSSAVQGLGVDIDAYSGITTDGTGFGFDADNLLIENNILQNFAGTAIAVYGTGGVATTGNVIQNNWIRSFGHDDYASGILLALDAYADIKDNLIDGTGSADIGNGIELLNTFQSGSMTWSNNTITVDANAVGINVNLFYGNSGNSLIIDGNTIKAVSGLTSSDYAWGINLNGVNGDASVEMNNNIIESTGGEFERGISVWASATTGTLAVAGGSISDALEGIVVDAVDPYFGATTLDTTLVVTNVSISDVGTGIIARSITRNVFGLEDPDANVLIQVTGGSISNASTGILVEDGLDDTFTAKVNFEGGTTFSSVPVGIELDGSEALLGATDGTVEIAVRLVGTGHVTDNLNLQASGTVSGGLTSTGIGTLHVDGNLQLDGTLETQFTTFTGSPAAGIEYDTIAVAGNVTIGAGAIFSSINANLFNPTPGSNITVIDNDGTLSGNFVGLTEGTSFNFGSLSGTTERSRIHYGFGTGTGSNDVLFHVNVQPTAAASTVTLAAPVTESTIVDLSVADLINLAGVNYLDPDTNAGVYGAKADPKGVAITGFVFTRTNPNLVSAGIPVPLTGAIANGGIDVIGQWQYSTNGGSSWTALVSVSDMNAFRLIADAGNLNRVRFVSTDNGTVSISFRAWDATDDAANATYGNATSNLTTYGATSAYSSNTATAELVVNNVAPTANSFTVNDADLQVNAGESRTFNVNPPVIDPSSNFALDVNDDLDAGYRYLYVVTPTAASDPFAAYTTNDFALAWKNATTTSSSTTPGTLISSVSNSLAYTFNTPGVYKIWTRIIDKDGGTTGYAISNFVVNLYARFDFNNASQFTGGPSGSVSEPYPSFIPVLGDSPVNVGQNVGSFYTPATGYGWVVDAGSPNLPIAVDFGGALGGFLDPVRRDAHTSSSTKVFRVDGQVANARYYINVIIGDGYNGHDRIQVRGVNGTMIYSSTDLSSNITGYGVNDISFGSGQFLSRRFEVQADANGVIQLEFSDLGGAVNGWIINAMTIRAMATHYATSIPDLQTETQIKLVRSTPTPATLNADGVTADIYTGTLASPNSLINIVPSAGLITAVSTDGINWITDADPYYVDAQVRSSATGQFYFKLQRPTSAQTVRIYAHEIEGFDSGYLDQAFVAPAPVSPTIDSMRIDFDPNLNTLLYTPTVAPGQTAWSNYKGGNYAAGFGWVDNTGILHYLRTAYKGVGSTEAAKLEDKLLKQDGHSFSGNDSIKQFRMDLSANQSYTLSLTFGQLNTAYDFIKVTASSGASINNISTLSGQFTTVFLNVTADATGKVILTIEDESGTPGKGGAKAWGITHLSASAVFAPLSLAQNSVVPATPAAPVTMITSSQLAPLVQTAIDYWAQAGASAIQVNTLKNASIEVASIAGSELGLAGNGKIWIDDDAAGLGWSTSLAAPAANKIDLLTVLLHEMGHLIGLSDIYTQGSNSIMTGTFSPGQRRLPKASDLTPLVTAPILAPTPVTSISSKTVVAPTASSLQNLAFDPILFLNVNELTNVKKR